MPDNSQAQPRVLDGILDGDLKDWINANWGKIHCFAQTSTELSLYMWQAIRNFEPGPGAAVSLSMIWRAAEAGYQLAGCANQLPEIEEIFEPSTKECQCAKSSGTLVAKIDAGLGAEAREDKSSMEEAKQIIRTYEENGFSFCVYKTPSGVERTAFVQRLDVYEQFVVNWYIRPQPGSVCCDELPDPPPKPPEIPGYQEDYPQPDDRYDYCYAGFRYIDSYIDRNGILWNKYLVYKNCPPYNIGSYYYWESIYGPWYVDREDELPPQPWVPNCSPISGLSQVRYSVSAGCTWNEEEGKYDTVYDAIVDETDDGILGLAWRLDAIAWLLEKVNLIPYGICDGCSKPELEGDWRTISFISDETSPEGKSRLRKRFRYRSTSSIDLNGLVDHWKDFTWRAGPVCVRHSGASWGDPQVWASTADEGKRVIRHAGREAGLDPDQVGKWGVSGSRNPRYGMPGTMRVNTTGGYYWITDRLESDNRPQVLAPSPDP